MGGQTTKQSGVTTTEPWSGQQPYLNKIFGDAEKAYDTTKTQGPYTGEFYSLPTEDQLNSYRGQIGAAGGVLQDLNNNQYAAADQMTSAGAAGTQGALSGLSGYKASDPSQTYSGSVGVLSGYNPDDPTSGNIANAGQYANNPQMDGMVTAAMRDANRNAAENVLPSLYRNAAGTGNINSSKAALSEGVINRGLAEKTADISANLRGDAYQRGLALSENARQFNDSSMLDANKSAATLEANRQQFGDQLGLNALQAYGALSNQASQLGQAGYQNALGGQGALNDMRNSGYDALQTAGQQQIDNAQSKYDYQSNFPFQQLGNFYNLVGDKSWGGTTTSFGQTKTNPGGLATAGTIAGIMGSLLKCDIRVKNPIKVLGTISGLPLWLFSYRDDPSRLHIGPMAQDVERVNPAAVLEIDGIKHIDLTKL